MSLASRIFRIGFLSIIFVIQNVLANKGSIIQGQLQMPDTKTPVNTTLITLNNEFSTYTTPSGNFTFYNVPLGVHLVDAHNVDYSFSQVKMQLRINDENNEIEKKCIEYVYPGAPKQPIECEPSIILIANAKYQYFETRRGFSIFGLLKNPMVLLMGVSVIMMVIMPKMMENLDPEQKEQMKKQMEMQQDPSKMLGQLWGELSGAPDSEQVGKEKRSKKDRGGKRMKRE